MVILATLMSSLIRAIVIVIVIVIVDSNSNS